MADIRKRRVRYDVLRFACVLSVIFYHFESAAEGVLPPVRFAGLTFDFLGLGINAGSLAVQLFFILSGALCAKTVHDDRFALKSFLNEGS